MKTNLLIALANLVNKPIPNIGKHYKASNRANNMGDSLEFYVKDLFCDSLAIKDRANLDKIYSKYFSYIGNQNNPPDVIVKNGDAIEVKKIEGISASLALNSSYPKDKLYADSPMITQACKNCEKWEEKDIIYVVGVIPKKSKAIKTLWFVYGDCYAASKATYERIRNKIADGVNGLSGVEFSETKELGRINKVDPLGITYFRIRGMWGIDNPAKVFDYLENLSSEKNFVVNSIMLKKKYLTFPEKDRLRLENLKNKGLSIRDVEIKSPNNPAKFLDAKLLQFAF